MTKRREIRRIGGLKKEGGHLLEPSAPGKLGLARAADEF